jgi:hypothetical protein
MFLGYLPYKTPYHFRPDINQNNANPDHLRCIQHSYLIIFSFGSYSLYFSNIDNPLTAQPNLFDTGAQAIDKL